MQWKGFPHLKQRHWKQNAAYILGLPSCVNDGYRSAGEKVHAQYRKKMEMIPFTKKRQTYCVIFFVLMVIGAIKLLVRYRRLVLFKNRVAQILVHNHWSKYTIEDKEKQDIFYCEVTICSDLVLLHNNIKVGICKHCLHSITLQGLSPSRMPAAGSILCPLQRA